MTVVTIYEHLLSWELHNQHDEYDSSEIRDGQFVEFLADVRLPALINKSQNNIRERTRKLLCEGQ